MSEEKKEDPLGIATLFTTWMNSMNDFWGTVAARTDADDAEAQGVTQPEAAPSKSQAAMSAAVKNWRTMVGAMSTPESVDALFKSGGAIPEISMKLAQAAVASSIEIQESMVERLNRMGESVEAYQFDEIDENLCRMWTEIYEKEFRQFFRIPQLGLMRTYQEKANRVADRYILFQSTLSEFLRLLGLPFSRSIQVMQEKLGQMAEAGELPDDAQVYYNMWVKVLEGHFMTLFQTSEYVSTLTRTIDALADFSAARDDALQDLLSILPVAKKTDLDDMARELYQVKKRLRKLEKA